MAADAQQAGKPKSGAIGIKETLTSLIIAFMLAFLFRGFVIEGFLIPTGSMAPTLLGKHLRMQSEQSGYNWSVGPWTYMQGSAQTPERMQNGIEAQDPMSGIPVIASNKRLAAGDRVFVLKYLPLLQEPHRWDVVVFKNPGQHVNYIKRLVGLPGEQVLFVDGDVFTRQFVENQMARSGWESWTTDGWQVQRKPERVQREMLQDVFDSSFAPVDKLEFKSPFTGEGEGWSGLQLWEEQNVIEESLLNKDLGRMYLYTGSAPTTLHWNDSRPITDFNAYNQTHKSINMFMTSDANSRFRPFPSSDLALSLDIRHDGEAGVVSPTIDARGMSFRAEVDLGAGSASVQMRDASSPESPWIELDAGSFDAVAARNWTQVEFWHIDQALWLFIDGVRVCGGMTEGAYELSPAQRAVAATGLSWDELEHYPGAGDGRDGLGVFADTTIYRKPSVRWEFEGSAFTLSHVRVQRDISYHINQMRVTRGAHPNYFSTLTDEQYFMCGDNSANSEDSRLWRDNDIYAWVRTEIDNTPGVVNRDLIVGKAFVVYFPAPLDNGPILSPDFGRLRWIW